MAENSVLVLLSIYFDMRICSNQCIPVRGEYEQGGPAIDARVLDARALISGLLCYINI